MSGDAFGYAEIHPYKSGEDINIYSGDVDVCVYKYGGYSGSPIFASVQGEGYLKQVVFNSFEENRSCVMMESVPANSNLKFITPMGMTGLIYQEESLMGNFAFALGLDNIETTDKYLRLSGDSRQMIVATYASGSFDANGGEGVMDGILAPIGQDYTLPKNTFTKTGYRFTEWNTKADGSGTGYADGATIHVSSANELNLYAQWREAAVLASGEGLNVKLKKLANPDKSWIRRYDNDYNMKAIKMANALPVGFDTTDENHIISADETISPKPIYAWFDDNDNDNDGVNDGIMYIYTDADAVEGGEDMQYVFFALKNLSDISGVADWDMSHTINMNELFRDTKISDISALTNWDVSNVKYMSSLFLQSSSIRDISPLENWDVSKVISMGDMFGWLYYLTDISPIAAWNTAQLSVTGSMFYDTGITNADALETKQHEGKDYVSWDMSKVTSISDMFNGAESLTDISALASWDVSNVGSMSDLFKDTAIEDISALAGWDTSKVKDMSGMFNGISELADISVLASWNTSKVKDMEYMFSGTAVANVDALETKQHEGKSYVSWDVSKVENMHCLFFNTYSLVDISALASWDVSKVKDMSATFNGATLLVNISPLASWNIASATDLRSMFSRTAIVNVDALETKQHEGKSYVSWDVSKVEYIGSIFSNASSLSDISALASWDTSSMWSMSSAFSNASSLSDISALASWDTSSMWFMDSAFEGTAITNLDALASWNVSNVSSVADMFADATSLTDVSGVFGWTLPSEVFEYSYNISGMFDNVPATRLPDWYPYA